jgi:hypothetical protein
VIDSCISNRGSSKTANDELGVVADRGSIPAWTLLKSGSSSSPACRHLQAGTPRIRIRGPSRITAPNASMSKQRLHSSSTAASSDLGGERGLLGAKCAAHPGRSSTRRS